MFHRRR